SRSFPQRLVSFGCHSGSDEPVYARRKTGGRFVAVSRWTLAQQRDLLCRLVIRKQLAEASPADKRVEYLVVILVRPSRDNRLANEVGVDRAVRLLPQDVMNLAKQTEGQKLFAPHGFAILRRGYCESPSLGGQCGQILRRLHEIEHFRGLYNA